MMMHPDLARKIKPAEPHFFNKDQLYYRGVRAYLKYMPISKPGQITFEKTPNYFVDHVVPGVPERIQKFNSSIRLLLIVRDPTKRIVSEYTHNSVRRR